MSAEIFSALPLTPLFIASCLRRIFTSSQKTVRKHAEFIETRGVSEALPRLRRVKTPGTSCAMPA